MLLTSVARAKKAAQRVECLNFQRQLYIFYYADNWDEDAYEDHPSYTKKELMDSYPRIKQSCFDCHMSRLTTVKMKSIKKTALKWRQKMEEAPRHLCPNDLSDEAFLEVLTRALWKKGMIVDIQGDFYTIIEA